MQREFQMLTGYKPFDWQTRLYKEYLEKGQVPAAIDVPAGLGKTAVMALWLVARSRGAALPRRLAYVVDRRAVVDQATQFAEILQNNLESPESAALKDRLGLEGRSLQISTLRGQHVDNRAWLEDPSSPAIVVGTVDMIGTRLLFEGYGVSRRMRPYHAGLLGADTLVVLDESHLVLPFEKLLETIEQKPDFEPIENNDRGLVPAFKLLSLSATGHEREGAVFRLEPGDYQKDREATRRLTAPKALKLVESASDLADALAHEAWSLSENGRRPVRCIVFCDKRESAQQVAEKIKKLAGRNSESQNCWWAPAGSWSVSRWPND